MKKILCTGALVTDVITGHIDSPVKAGDGLLAGIGIHAGGNAFNVSAGLVKLGVSGEKICCAGAIGEDSAGHIIMKEFEKYGINARLFKTKEKSTAKAVILQFKDGQRGFIVDKGAGVFFPAEEVLSAIREFKPGIFYIGEPGMAGEAGGRIGKILRQSKEKGCVTIVDYVVIGKHDPESLFDSAGYTDFLHCNDYEAEQITGRQDVKDAMEFLMEKGFKTAAITCGGGETLCAFNGGIYNFPVFSITCEDATGAGDAFTAGIIRKLAEKNGFPASEEEFTEIIIYAQAAGASCVSRQGCTAGINLSEINSLISRQGPSLMDAIKKY